MPFLGVEPVQEFASVAKQTITGDGSTAYTLTHSVGSANDLAVFVNNVRQEPTTAYSASGATITFTEAIASTDSCYVMYIARTFSSASPEANSVGITELNVSDGSNGQALTTNGSGTLSFATVTTATPTLAAVTGAGATTTNAITIGNLTSTGIDDNATSTAITISSAEKVGINNASPSELLSMIGTGGTAKVRFDGDSSNLQNNFIGITGYDDLIIASDEANSGTASTIQFRVDAGEKMRILSGGGITFNGDTAAANALDDYEEGTWTPYLQGYGQSTPMSQTYSSQLGLYRKVGNIIYVSYRITLTGKGNMSGNYLLLMGLPYNIGGTTHNGGYGGINYFNHLSQSVSSLWWEIGAGTYLKMSCQLPVVLARAYSVARFSKKLVCSTAFNI